MTPIHQAIANERAFQKTKYPDSEHDLMTWIRIMAKELAEAEHALIKEPRENALREILQVIAVGYAALEQHGVVERANLGGNHVLCLHSADGDEFFHGYVNTKAQWGTREHAYRMNYAQAVGVWLQEKDGWHARSLRVEAAYE